MMGTCSWCKVKRVEVDWRPFPRIMRHMYANYLVTHGYLCASCSEDARVMVERERAAR